MACNAFSPDALCALRPIKSGLKSAFRVGRTREVREDRRSQQCEVNRQQFSNDSLSVRRSYFFPLVINKQFDWFIGTCGAPLTTANYLIKRAKKK